MKKGKPVVSKKTIPEGLDSAERAEWLITNDISYVITPNQYGMGLLEVLITEPGYSQELMLVSRRYLNLGLNTSL